MKLSTAMPDFVKNIVVKDASNVEEVASEVDLSLCGRYEKDEIKALEEAMLKQVLLWFQQLCPSLDLTFQWLFQK